jgi:hypothetical protein
VTSSWPVLVAPRSGVAAALEDLHVVSLRCTWTQVVMKAITDNDQIPAPASSPTVVLGSWLDCLPQFSTQLYTPGHSGVQSVAHVAVHNKHLSLCASVPVPSTLASTEQPAAS